MKTKEPVLLLIAAIIALSFFLGRWSTSGLRSAQYDEISELRDVMRIYQVELRDREQTIYEKDQLLGTQKEAIQAGIIERDLLKATNIKKATQITQLEARLQAAIDSIPISDTVFITVDNEDGSGETETYAKLPFSWNYSDQWLSLQTGINLERQGWFQLEAPTGFSIVLGGKDGKQVAAVTTPSPYITVTDFNVVRLNQEKWYYKPWVPAVGGFAGGVVTGWLIWRK
jgi:hypothetical protein